VSEAVKIHPKITKSDGLVIYDRDNVMVDPTIYITMREAEIALANYTGADIWSVVVERKQKVNDAPKVKRGKKLRPLIIEYVKGDSLI
jgi:hypothetical protein